jgi:surfactin synthase thioesterase subunit
MASSASQLPSIACRSAAVSCGRSGPAALLRLVCFSHAGGGPAAFRGWAEALAPDVELWAVTLPGRASRAHEPCARGWQPLVDTLASVIYEKVAEPLALFGHSLGALLAFEVAREFNRNGSLELAQLVISACAAPHIPRAVKPPDDDQELLEQIQRLYDGIPDALGAEPELLAAILPVLRADVELACNYRFTPAPPLRCAITAIGGESDPTVQPEALSAWAAHTCAACEVHRLSGGHFYMQRQRAVVFEILRRSLLK